MIRPASEQGTVTAFVAVVATALVMVAGMAYDGGQVIAAHNRAIAAASQAARAGAQEIDLTTLRSTGDIHLDAAAATRAALDHLDRLGIAGTASVDGDEITVTATVTQPLRILPGADRDVTATRTATADDGEAP